MRIRILSVILVLSVFVIVVLLARFRNQVEPQIRQQTQERETMQNSLTHPAVIDSGNAALPATKVESARANAPAERDLSFKRWLDREADQVDQVHVDPAAKKAEYQNIIKNLTPAQAEELSRTATDQKSSSGQKILSVYLLVEGGPLTRAALENFIAAPMEDFGPPTPHTEAEMRGSQSRALRIMAVDGLLSQASQDPALQQSLSQTLANISDPYIRKYADKRMGANAH